jgi:ribosomal protein S17E
MNNLENKNSIYIKNKYIVKIMMNIYTKNLRNKLNKFKN